MRVAPPDQALTDAELDHMGFCIEHFFGGGAYMKVTRLLAGSALGQHAHVHDHLSVLVSGSVELTEGEDKRVLDGFNVVTLYAGKEHIVHAISDAVWICAWAIDDTDPATVDQSILKG